MTTTVIRPEDRTSSATLDGQGSAVILDYWEPDVRAVQQIEAVPRILETVARLTGMGLVAIARVTDERWVCCAVRDSVDFGMRPGSEKDLKSTICDEIRQNHQPVVIDEVAFEVTSSGWHAKLHPFQSYISVPIVLKDDVFFGTLCAADPQPARHKNPEIVATMRLFADLIASELHAAKSQSACQRLIALVSHDVRESLESVAASVKLLSEASLDGPAVAAVGLIRANTDRMARTIGDALDQARGQLGG